MKKIIKSLAVLAVIAVAFVSASTVFAQTSGPRTESGFGGGKFGEPLHIGEDGLLHDYFIAAYADALEGIDAAELEKRLEDGETMSEIALSTGLTFEEVKDLIAEVRTLVLEQALADGVITEEQAEWLASRGSRMAQGTGSRQDAGRRGKGQGTGHCIND